MPPDTDLPPIHVVRGQRVMLDGDLARLYGVATKVFNQTIRRNVVRFPSDFAFQLTREEVADLKSQIVTSSSAAAPVAFHGHGGARKLPWAFTEHGAIMAATILRSPRAVAMSVYVVRAFVRLREEALAHAVIVRRLAQIDKRLLEHDPRRAPRRFAARRPRPFGGRMRRPPDSGRRVLPAEEAALSTAGTAEGLCTLAPSERTAIPGLMSSLGFPALLLPLAPSRSPTLLEWHRHEC